MSRYEDLTNQKFGELTAESYAGSKNGNALWNCICECGNRVVVAANDLKRGHTKSCGKHQYEDLTNQEFGILTVESYAGSRNGHVYWNCVCKCGNRTIVNAGHLKSGHTSSCGCIGNSLGEKTINDLLSVFNISHKPQFIFDDLKYIDNLEFDFAIFREDNLEFLLEYHGEQHDPNSRAALTNSDFGKQQREVTDPMKLEYCKKNNIKTLFGNMKT